MFHQVRKAFHGWFFPDKKQVNGAPAESRQFVGTMGQLSAAVSRVPHVSNGHSGESFLYVGCIHGGTGGLYHRLETLAQHPPDYLVCAGDLTGSPELERMKKEFYDKQSDHDARLHGFEYFGDWATTLPKKTREALLATIEPCMKKLVRILSHFRKHGTRVMLLEGNWDNPLTTGIRAIADGDVSQPFDPRAFFTAHQFRFITTLTMLETHTTVQVFLPYITLLHFSLISSRRMRAVRRQIKKARGEGKRVVLVGHAEANWRMHHLSDPLRQPGKERESVIRHFSQAIALFVPDEVIYPHQHERMVDERGKPVDLNTKYLLQVIRSHPPHLRLVERLTNERLPVGTVVATYIPKGYMAIENYQ